MRKKETKVGSEGLTERQRVFPLGHKNNPGGCWGAIAGPGAKNPASPKPPGVLPPPKNHRGHAEEGRTNSNFSEKKKQKNPTNWGAPGQSIKERVKGLVSDGFGTQRFAQNKPDIKRQKITEERTQATRRRAKKLNRARGRGDLGAKKL